MAGIWRKTLIYLGLVEDDELDDYYDDLEPEPAAPRRAAGPRATPRANPGGPEGVVRPLPTAPPAMFHLVMPSTFNDAQEVGDKFRDGFSVIMNLQGVDAVLRRRLIDFASGLAYGLAGSMQPAADNVFLITPNGVQVSAEERRRFLEERGFFNQA
ncbi:MAG TPA: cell division protein SepF [Actinomycetota bacterium]|nr:cell division protein SepF [Actinomycetota bacterium]